MLWFSASSSQKVPHLIVAFFQVPSKLAILNSRCELDECSSRGQILRMLFLRLITLTVLGLAPYIESSESCTATSTCVLLEASRRNCLGASLPYTKTSLNLATDSSNLDEMVLNRQVWTGLQAVPKCWVVLQPLLCAVYTPKCDNNRIELYPRSLCLATREPCRIVSEYYSGSWPEFLDCDQPQFTSEESCQVRSDERINLYHLSCAGESKIHGTGIYKMYCCIHTKSY